jgi:formamidopyrimidine-DNA glycosylase
MPELPDIEIFTKSLDSILAGKKLDRIKIINGKKLKNSQAEFTKALAGKKLNKVYRSGKEMRFAFSGGKILGIHLMLTGDIFVLEEKNEYKTTIAELYFSAGSGRGNKILVLTDRMKNAHLDLDPVDKEGVDALSKELNFNYLKNALQRKTTIKKLLIDQNVIRGIGNGYSDEILWASRISPYSIANMIPDKKIKDLLIAIKKILKQAILQIYKKYKGKVNNEVKEFLKIHTKTKDKSPTGKPILIDQKGMMKTYYTKEQILYI